MNIEDFSGLYTTKNCDFDRVIGNNGRVRAREVRASVNRGVAMRQARTTQRRSTKEQAIHLAYAHSNTASLRCQIFSLRSLFLLDLYPTDGRQGSNSRGRPPAAHLPPTPNHGHDHQDDAPHREAPPYLAISLLSRSFPSFIDPRVPFLPAATMPGDNRMPNIAHGASAISLLRPPFSTTCIAVSEHPNAA